ncbi:MAG: CBS domain-containing protein [Desulfobulbus sp.]|nr:CBS domain-containing protein [Desulfobulbus sp.]
MGGSRRAISPALNLHWRWPHVYVVDADHRFLGAISVHDFAPRLRAAANPSAPLPAELVNANYPRVTPDMGLGRVLEAFAGHSGERLPLVDAQGKLLGTFPKPI